MKKENSEFEAFDKTMTDLLKVSHSEIKSKLEEEKAQKQTKKTESKKQKGRLGSRNLTALCSPIHGITVDRATIQRLLNNNQLRLNLAKKARTAAIINVVRIGVRDRIAHLTCPPEISPA